MIWLLVPPCTSHDKFSPKVSPMKSFLGSSLWRKKIPPSLHIKEGHNMVNEGLHKSLSAWKYIYIYSLMLFYCGLVCYYRINLFITFTKQQLGENRFFLLKWHRLPLLINCDRQAVLCLMFVFLFCNCFVPFVPLISTRNCTLFFSVFVNFIFSNFRTILLCLHVIPLLSFNNFFIINL